MVRIKHIIEFGGIAPQKIFVGLADGDSRHNKTSSYRNCISYTVEYRIPNLHNTASRIVAYERHTLVPLCLRADMLNRRRVERRIVEDIECRPRLRGARIDVPRNVAGKDVRSIKGYKAPYCEEKEASQTGVPTIDSGGELHYRGIGALVRGAAAQDGREAIEAIP
jgi:hypothetical protein